MVHLLWLWLLPGIILRDTTTCTCTWYIIMWYCIRHTQSPYPKRGSWKKQNEDIWSHAYDFQCAPYRWRRRRIVIICHTWETNFRRPPLAESSVGAQSSAGDYEGCDRGGAWDGRRGWSGGAWEQPFWNVILKPTPQWTSKARHTKLPC